ncbi:MAG: hypothetical protein QM754_07775 [Tepidisphaeraceae bacterium]
MIGLMLNLLADATAGTAKPTPDDVFKSMNQSMSADINPAQVLAVVAAVVGLIVLVSTFKKRADKKTPKPAIVSQPNKLLRQVAKEAGLTRKEVRELKKLAALEGVTNPLTLLLCPSLMQAAIAKRQAGR